MKKPQTVKSLEELGRIQLSKSFFMREFLYSEISQIESIPNIPDDPDLAIAAGRNLCEKVLEPLQDALGRISVRSAFRASAVNKIGSENQNQYSCASNEANYAGHIWDVRDQDGYMGATACIVVTSFIPYYEQTGDWTALAWWIHDHIDAYSEMTFFPKYAAFNITWHENPECKKVIYSYVKNPHTQKNSGYLTKTGMENFSGSHEQFYQEFMRQLHPAS
ncbi:MAG: peptidase M15 [Tychonema bourrellyi B0820]|uniref:Peptidase M15 n=1 Tax=Tychonema bourrellyi FEM_GT703 TaxID=2040638 RepID=A0A2G4F341_9CYAN|nr:peptidase M15 [Tychonema bourrellyi]MDQ2099549.1 peptidase M15 [Tychonema bourrellyi B0820]PHX56166.1 peptidase M15 [Tychonema bourrellyi FEM_GT703]